MGEGSVAVAGFLCVLSVCQSLVLMGCSNAYLFMLGGVTRHGGLRIQQSDRIANPSRVNLGLGLNF